MSDIVTITPGDFGNSNLPNKINSNFDVLFAKCKAIGRSDIVDGFLTRELLASKSIKPEHLLDNSINAEDKFSDKVILNENLVISDIGTDVLRISKEKLSLDIKFTNIEEWSWTGVSGIPQVFIGSTTLGDYPAFIYCRAYAATVDPLTSPTTDYFWFRTQNPTNPLYYNVTRYETQKAGTGGNYAKAFYGLHDALADDPLARWFKKTVTTTTYHGIHLGNGIDPIDGVYADGITYYAIVFSGTVLTGIDEVIVS